MRTLRLSLAATLWLVAAAVLPPSVVGQGGDPADATSDPPGHVTVIEDLVYATGDGPDAPTELRLDAYVGAEGDDAPLVVYVPGYLMGAHEGGLLAQALADEGATVLVVDGPRLSAEAAIADNAVGIRTMVDTVACAVRFARASEYGSETAPLVLVGFSHGGGVASHLALAGADFARLWEEYTQSGDGPPRQIDCTLEVGSTRVDAFVGIAGSFDAFVGYEGRYGRDFMLEHEPDLWETLWSTVGLHPELRVRLIHGAADNLIPLENSLALEAVLAQAGYDVELIGFDGGHTVPDDLAVETVMELVE